MKYLKHTLILSSFIIVLSCLGEKKNADKSVSEVAEVTSVEMKNNIEIDKIKKKLCETFPQALVLKYNSDITHIDIESVDNGSGGILHCNVKLFYGKKEYEFWKGQVSASINKMEDPFWQYNPERNATLYHKLDDLGEQAVYISNMYQLLILKAGVLYSIALPNRFSNTNSGKDTKAVVIELAKHYNL